jgi:Ras-related protein Rab-21
MFEFGPTVSPLPVLPPCNSRRSYVNNVFSDKQQSTMQGASVMLARASPSSHPHRAASFLSKRLNINAATVNLAIWDTAGQERFHALGPIYYRDADGDH